MRLTLLESGLALMTLALPSSETEAVTEAESYPESPPMPVRKLDRREDAAESEA